MLSQTAMSGRRICLAQLRLRLRPSVSLQSSVSTSSTKCARSRSLRPAPICSLSSVQRTSQPLIDSPTMDLLRLQQLQNQAKEKLENLGHKVTEKGWYSVGSKGETVMGRCIYCDREAIIHVPSEVITGRATYMICPSEDDHEPNIKRR